MKMYETCDTLSSEFEGLKVEAANEDEAMEKAIDVLESHGYSIWCEENGFMSYDFQVREVWEEKGAVGWLNLKEAKKLLI